MTGLSAVARLFTRLRRLFRHKRPDWNNEMPWGAPVVLDRDFTELNDT